MFQFLYLIAFAIVAFFAISNLLRSMMSLRQDINQGYGSSQTASNSLSKNKMATVDQASHPELLDEGGNVVREPYLVMKSISVEDAREKLDALYNASPDSSSNDDDSTKS